MDTRKQRYIWGVCLTVLALVSCTAPVPDLETGVASLSTEPLMRDVQELSSDRYEGRFPATAGEELTIRYLEKRFKEVGTEPGNKDSYFQDVPMVEITNDPDAVLSVAGSKENMGFAYGPDFISWTLQKKEQVNVQDSDMIFVGYGIVAPEYAWNDYQGMDVKGKTVVMLVNDPGFATQDPGLFKGKAMTYYGRWTYKYEEAARQGAAAALLIHETEPAAYDWGVVRNSWSGPRMSLKTEDNNISRCVVEAWISQQTARRILAGAGLDYDLIKSESVKQGFQARDLKQKASISIRSAIREVVSRNVVARIPGAEQGQETIIYTAHWDHFGKDPNLEGDQIYNGALDNATGTAALIELARAFKALGAPTGRSILFLAVTGEEQGLLGSEYYATHPIYPLTRTVAVINMDSLNIYGRTRDIWIVGYGQSELDDFVRDVAAEQDRVVLPNPTPEKGSFFRSDHFPFAKQGVPALFAGSGIDHREKGEEWGRQQREEYGRLHYHKPSDEFDPDWDMRGALEDMKMYFKIGFRLAESPNFPQWKEGSEFKARRDAAFQKQH